MGLPFHRGAGADRGAAGDERVQQGEDHLWAAGGSRREKKGWNHPQSYARYERKGLYQEHLSNWSWIKLNPLRIPMAGEGGHRWRVKRSRELRKRTRCPTWGSLQRGRRCNRYEGFQIYMCNVHRTWYQHMGLHHLQIRKGLSFMHATRQPPIQILSRIYISSGDRSGGGGKVGDQGKDFAGGTTCRRKVHFCILSFWASFFCTAGSNSRSSGMAWFPCLTKWRKWTRLWQPLR